MITMITLLAVITGRNQDIERSPNMRYLLPGLKEIFELPSLLKAFLGFNY
jgi:hypothetical protein